jgi:TIR domain/Bacterial Ig domain
VKIVVSYSRTDAGHLAKKIHKDLTKEGYDVFIDISSIRVGDKWSNTIEENISKCDIFVIIVTPWSLKSVHVEREVLQAQREGKRIIPCFHSYIIDNDVKWNLNSYQGIEFDDKYDLALKLYGKIEEDENKTLNKIDDEIILNKSIGITSTKEAKLLPIEVDDKRIESKILKDNKTGLTGAPIYFKNAVDLKEENFGEVYNENGFKGKKYSNPFSQIKNESLENHKKGEAADISTKSGIDEPKMEGKVYSDREIKRKFPKIIIGGIAGAIALIIVIAVVMYSGSHNQQTPNYHSSPINLTKNYPPIVFDSSATTKMNQPVDIQLQVSDKDPNDDLAASIVSNPSHGLLGVINQSTGTVTYTPNSGFTGTDAFKFKAYDGKTYSNNTATVLITVS